MPIADQLKKAGQWLATFLLGSTAFAMAANALDVMFNHTAPRGQMYSFATAAAVSAYLAHYVYSAIREGERLRQLRSPGAAQLLGTGEAPDAPWLHASAVCAPNTLLAAARIERDCPFCAEPILTAARLCKHCHSDVSATADDARSCRQGYAGKVTPAASASVRERRSGRAIVPPLDQR